MLKGRLYSCKIYDNGTLVRDFVPCTNTDGVTGLYDIVTNTFYTDAAGGSFAAGTSTLSVARKIKKGYIGIGGFVPKSLPSGYTQVEYIESSGTQYIDTGIYPNQNTKVVMDVQMTSANTAEATNAFFGVRTSASSEAYGVHWNHSTERLFLFYNDGYSYASMTEMPPRLTVTQDKNILTFGSVSITRTYGAFECEYPMFLLAFNLAGTADWMLKGRLYSTLVYDNGVLVRDFVPCVNSSGTAGLYDLVNNVFYINAGTGAFTVGGSDPYAAIACRIKKAYIGIGGIARPCWSGGELAYYGTATSLNSLKHELSATSVGNYALFGGGGDYNYALTSEVNAYNKSLTHTMPTALSESRYQFAATTVGNYALFGGGQAASNYSSVVDAYNISLTRTTPTALSKSRYHLAATTIGNYALFGGGNSQGEGVSNVDAYNASLTKTTPTALSTARYQLAATSVGNYALFGGGMLYYMGNSSSVVNAYNTSLTRSIPTALSSARYMLAATSVGNYALFGGGYGTTYSAVVDVYDASLTRSTATALSSARYGLAATTVGNYALFGGGNDGNKNNYNSSIVDVYDASLIKTTATALSEARENLAAATVGDYALFGGGGYSESSTSSNTVDVYVMA